MHWGMIVGIAVALVVGWFGAHSMLLMSWDNYVMIVIGAYLLYCGFAYKSLSMAHRGVMAGIGALIVGYNLRMIM